MVERRYSVSKADPSGYWLVPDGVNDPKQWACMDSADPVEEIEDLRAKLEDAEERASGACYLRFLSMSDEMEKLEAKLAAAEAASGAYLTFMLTELDWKWFRAETFGDTASEQNAKKLRDWLAENGDPGPAFLERVTSMEKDIATLREDKARMDWIEANTTLHKSVETGYYVDHYEVNVLYDDNLYQRNVGEDIRAAIDAAREK